MGRKCSMATRRKLSIAGRGRRFSEGHKKKLSEAATGRRFTKEERRKISEGLKGKKRKPFTAETRRRMSIAKKGKGLSKEHKRKLSEALIGRRVPDQHRIKLSLTMGGDGDIDRLNNRRYDRKHTEWAKAVYKRDNYTCQLCYKSNCILHAHHVKMAAKYPNLKYKLSNGITLCSDCHLEKVNGHEEEYEFIFRIIRSVCREYNRDGSRRHGPLRRLKNV